MSREAGLPKRIGAIVTDGKPITRDIAPGTRLRPLQAVLDHIDRFSSEFLAYLPDNLHVYAAFEREALLVAQSGMRHYSARTIIEVLRHNSALSQSTGPWKLNDHFTPSLARLFALLHPQHAGLFEFRETRAMRAA